MIRDKESVRGLIEKRPCTPEELNEMSDFCKRHHSPICACDGCRFFWPERGRKPHAEEQKSFNKNDSGKPRYSLIPANALAEVVAVLEHGAEKYGADNWRKCDDETRYWDAAHRHLWEHLSGLPDKETGKSHLAHAICSLLFMLALEGAGE